MPATPRARSHAVVAQIETRLKRNRRQPSADSSLIVGALAPAAMTVCGDLRGGKDQAFVRSAGGRHVVAKDGRQEPGRRTSRAKRAD